MCLEELNWHFPNRGTYDLKFILHALSDLLYLPI